MNNHLNIPLTSVSPTATTGVAADDLEFTSMARQLVAEAALLRRLRIVAMTLVTTGLALLFFDATTSVGTAATVVGSVLMSVWIRRTNPT